MMKAATLSSSILTIISGSTPSQIIQTTLSIYLNGTAAPYSCDDTYIACLAYKDYCAREIEFSGIPCRVLCPRTCDTCKYEIHNIDRYDLFVFVFRL
jgi:hypothetical protein